jgi:hypothetical protein
MSDVLHRLIRALADRYGIERELGLVAEPRSAISLACGPAPDVRREAPRLPEPHTVSIN